MYIPDDKELFAALLTQREAIEAAIGATPEWRELPDRKASRIILFEPGDFRDEDESARLVEWLVGTAERFASIFPTYVSGQPHLNLAEAIDTEAT